MRFARFLILLALLGMPAGQDERLCAQGPDDKPDLNGVIESVNDGRLLLKLTGGKRNGELVELKIDDRATLVKGNSPQAGRQAAIWLVKGSPVLVAKLQLRPAPQGTGGDLRKADAAKTKAYVAPKRDPAPVVAMINEHISRTLRERKIPASPAAEDAEFLRRVTLDLTGRVPSYRQTTAFLESKEPDKRRRLIEELLASMAYGEHFATVWRNLIVPREEGAGDKPTNDKMGPWLAEQFNKGRGWNEIVAELLTAEGDVRQTPQLGFVMANSDNFQPQPSRLADSTSRLFWGVQLRCAECHNHPFASWKQSEFWSTAAFFGRVRFTGFKGNKASITDSPAEGKEPPADATITLPMTAGKKAGQVVRAGYLRGTESKVDGSASLRQTFAGWATSKVNPYFARAAVNRWWGHFLGRGFVQPLDGFDEGVSAVHGELLDRLTREFIDSGFDLKHLCRAIVLSEAYQRSSRPLPENEQDRELFSHVAARVLSPEAFYDSVAIVMGADPRTGLGLGVKLEPRATFVRSFRPIPDGAAAEGSPQGIPQHLKLLNAPLLHQTPALVANLVAGKAASEPIETLYLATLSRRPSPEEMQLMSSYLSQQPDRQAGYAGVLWILLNSSEFALNH